MIADMIVKIFDNRGRGDDGRLGHGDNGWKYVPRLTHSLTGQIITRVTCGSYHTAAVSSNGDLYVSCYACDGYISISVDHIVLIVLFLH